MLVLYNMLRYFVLMPRFVVTTRLEHKGYRLLFHIAECHNVGVNWPVGHSHRLYSWKTFHRHSVVLWR